MRRIVLASLLLTLLTLPVAAAADWPTATLGDVRQWDHAYDPAKGARFIPFQLIVPGVWNGTRTIEQPDSVAFTDAGGDTWRGALPDQDFRTGTTVRAYWRERTTRREGTVRQRFAVREQQDGLGRVYDSRFGEIRCSGEIKFPLGEWRQGETRRNEYACTGRDGRAAPRVNVITIEQLDFPCRGVPHCLQFTWTHLGENGKPLDDRRYVLAPGLGLIASDRR